MHFLAHSAGVQFFFFTPSLEATISETYSTAETTFVDTKVAIGSIEAVVVVAVDCLQSAGLQLGIPAHSLAQSAGVQLALAVAKFTNCDSKLSLVDVAAVLLVFAQAAGLQAILVWAFKLANAKVNRTGIKNAFRIFIDKKFMN